MSKTAQYEDKTNKPSKQTATQCSSPLQRPCGCEHELCQLSETGQITVICPFIIPISDSWHFQKTQLAFSSPDKTLQMWAAMTLDPTSFSLNLLRQFSVTNSPESQICHWVRWSVRLREMLEEALVMRKRFKIEVFAVDLRCQRSTTE